MEIKEIKNNLFKLDDDNNDIVLNSLNIAIKSYFCSYASVREQFDKRTYHETYSKDYYENFSETILHFHHFFELLLKELLKNEHKLLPIDITRESKVLVKLITNKPLEDNEKLNNNTLAFKSLLDRTCKLISLEPNIHFGFIKNHKASLDLLNDIRNGIWHKGENMLKYEAYDYLIGKYILPLAVKFLECSNYMEKYKKTQLWVFKENSIKINPLELIIKEFEKEKIDIGKVAVLKELGRASYYSHYGKGFEDERGDLFFELLRFIKTNKPKAVFIENVKNMVTHDHGNTFKVIREALTMNGYYIKWQVLNGKDYGNIPQNRERIYIVGFTDKEAFENFNFPEPIELTKKLSDIIDFSSQKDDRYYYREGRQPFYKKLSDEVTKKYSIYQWRRQYVRENKTGVVPTLTANMGTGGHNVPIILSDSGIRKLTPRETFNAQGFPMDFKLPENMSNGQLYKQAGNSVVVPVVKRIAANMEKALDTVTKKKKSAKEFHGKYYVMYTIMKGRFTGESYLAKVLDSEEELVNFAKEKDINYLTKEEYTKDIKKNKEIEFYSYE